jgi:AGZA family xanthine/uracil permease-like MFS transporter
MRWFVRGDIDGFFGLALDNLVQLLLIVALCSTVLGFSPAIIYGRVLPGAAVSLLIGNLFYAWQAKELAWKTRRTDVCALPYGINTVSLIAYVFLVMLPVKRGSLERGLTPEVASEMAWQAGLIACMGCGAIEFIGSFFAGFLKKIAPRAALLSTLAGIALGFIAMTFLMRTFARPIVGITTFGVIMLTYFGGVRFKGGLPGGLVAVGLGTAIAWIEGLAPAKNSAIVAPDFYTPTPVIGELIRGFRSGYLLDYLSIIVPMGLFNLIGSLQNIESAEAAGDSYPVCPSLAVNGVGTIAASLFGSCFPTTIYIGHPGWKAMGARAGYSIINAAFFTVVCLTGVLGWITYAVPIDAGMAIVLYIGIVITAQAFQATPREHAPAVVIGMLPGIAAWGTLMAKQALQVAGSSGGPALTQDLVPLFQGRDNWIDGAFAISEGFIFTSMILAAATVAVIERRFRVASLWCFSAAVLSALGLMHSYRYVEGDTSLDLWAPAANWAMGYALMGLLFLIAPYITEPSEKH